MQRFSRIAALGVAIALAAVSTTVAAGGALVLEARSIESTTADYAISARYPHTGVAAIDADVVAWVNQEIADLKEQGPPDPDSAAGAYTLDLDYEVARNDGAVLALLFTEMTFTGGAHPNHGVHTFNYRMPAARRIRLAEVIDGEPGLQRLSTLAIADLSRHLSAPEQGADPEGIAQGAGPTWSNFDNFLLLPEAIRLVFPPYQVAAYVFGTQEASIPLARLGDVLRRDRAAAAASFDCAKAGTPSERTICSDAALARLDRELGQAYAARLVQAGTPAAKEATRAQQRAWLKIRDRACGDQTGTAAVSCLTGVYRARHSDLLARP